MFLFNLFYHLCHLFVIFKFSDKVTKAEVAEMSRKQGLIAVERLDSKFDTAEVCLITCLVY